MRRAPGPPGFIVTPIPSGEPVTEPDHRHPRADRLVRRSSIAVVVFVGVIAAFVSYRHAYELVHTHGEEGTAAAAGPLTIDGMIYASGMVLLQAARHKIRAPRLAYVGLWLGIAATIGANVAHGAGHGAVGALVSAWPAVALIVSYELLMKIIRAGGEVRPEPAAHHRSTTGRHCPHPVAATADEAVQVAWLHGRDCLGDEPSQRHLERQFRIDRKRVAALVRAVAPPEPEPAARHTPNGRAAAHTGT
jgi:hypothetical protein